jgi:hypothetical protein
MTKVPAISWHALLAAVLAAAVLYAGMRWGALVAGGSDSYGYVSEAGLWQRGLPILHQDIVRTTPWPDATETWSPLGYRTSPHERDAIVPIYAPVLPLLMALAQRIAGFCGAFLIVPLCAALTVWLTYGLGRRLFEAPRVALAAECLVAASPVFLYQSMNAMSDIPVTAAWTLALALAIADRPLASGLAMSVAIAIRPNLAPLASVLVAWLLVAHRLSGTGPWRVFRFGIGVAPSIVGIAWLNATLYESPLVSGYGTTSDYYALGFLWTNVRQFAVWTADVETPVVAFAALYFLVPRLFPEPRVPAARLLLGGTLAVAIGSYLFYRPFDAWWYLRFLLPTWPVLMLLTAAAVDAIARRWLPRAGPAALAALVALLAWHGITTARARSAFDLGRGERRYLDVARWAAARTDPRAVFLSVQHSGSLRLYADRLTLRWDRLDPLWLDRAVEHLRSIGRHPYFVLDGEEVDAFQRRFGAASRTGAVDWTPLATLGRIVSIYDPLDRSGESPLAIATTRGRRGVWLCDPPQSWPPLLRMK